MFARRLRAFSTSSSAANLLAHSTDRYGGVKIEPVHLPPTAAEFASRLEASMSAWIATGKRAVWIEYAEFDVFVVCAMSLSLLVVKTSW